MKNQAIERGIMMTNIVDRDISERFDIDDIRKIRDNDEQVQVSSSEQGLDAV